MSSTRAASQFSHVCRRLVCTGRELGAFHATSTPSEIDRITRLIAVYELYAALVAIDQRGQRPGDRIEAVRDFVRMRIPPYEADRPYGPEIECLATLVEAEDFPLPENLLAD